jgi:hypothetical protein
MVLAVELGTPLPRVGELLDSKRTEYIRQNNTRTASQLGFIFRAITTALGGEWTIPAPRNYYDVANIPFRSDGIDGTLIIGTPMINLSSHTLEGHAASFFGMAAPEIEDRAIDYMAHVLEVERKIGDDYLVSNSLQHGSLWAQARVANYLLPLYNQRSSS